MISKWNWILSQLSTKLWLRASIFCVVGALGALSSTLIEDFLPDLEILEIGAEAVGDILNILASSMLVVTTFSLSVMVAAYTAAANSATPRSTKLLLADRTAQNALSTFIGTFLFSLVGIIALKVDVYGNAGRLVLFIMTSVVVVLVILALLRWIEHLSHLGRVGHTIDIVEEAATKSITTFEEQPFLGGVQLPNNFKEKSSYTAVSHTDIGYIQYIDMSTLSNIAEKLDCHLYLQKRTGHFNDSAEALVYADQALEEKDIKHIQSSFSIGGDRSFEQDPQYGLVVLSEIASRALSPAVNDPGTAIDVIGTQVRVLSHLIKKGDVTKITEGIESKYTRVFIPLLNAEELFSDAFNPIARDGRGMIEVSLCLQKALISLSNIGNEDFAPTAKRIFKYTTEQALTALALEIDREKIQELKL